ncbi:MAG: hypothetical protein AAGF95_33255, partial [Chloroflexota bacterium]
VHSEALNLSRKDINNIKFHLAMLTTMTLTKKSSNIKVENIQNIDISQIGDELLSNQISKILHVYQELGASDQVAKGPHFVKRLTQDFQDTSLE